MKKFTFIIGILLYPFMLLLVRAIKQSDKDEKNMIDTYNKNIRNL